MAYKCKDCGQIFDEPRHVHTSYEYYYGCAGMFGNTTPMDIEKCPCCESEDFIEVNDENYLTEYEIDELNEILSELQELGKISKENFINIFENTDDKNYKETISVLEDMLSFEV